MIVGADEQSKCATALLTTKGQVGRFVHRLIVNNQGLTWAELERQLKEYYGTDANPEKAIVELANVRQGKREGVQPYIQRVLDLAERAYVGTNRAEPLVQNQIKQFFISGLRDPDIRLAVRREAPPTAEEAFRLSLAEYKWRSQDETEDEEEPMEVCHTRRRPRAAERRESRWDRHNEDTRGAWRRDNGRTPAREQRNFGEWRGGPDNNLTCWSCGMRGHMQRFCRRRFQGNGPNPSATPSANGRRYQNARNWGPPIRLRLR